ncbi:MAG: hypothetical protein ACLQNE_08650 [Thermoguttaceae bacterium]
MLRELRWSWIGEWPTPIISEESGWDPNRDTGNIALTSSVKTAIDPLSYLVGAVRVVYGSDPAKTEIGKQTDCFRVLSGGKMPLHVENTDATVTVANTSLAKAVLLDVNGMATKTPVGVMREGGKFSVVLPPTALYVVLSK